MIRIKNKEEKVRELRYLFCKQDSGKTFAEFVESRAKNDPGFFRWLTGNRQIADYGESLSAATRIILMTSLTEF